MSMQQEKAEFLAACDVSRETLARLEVYAALLQKWSPKINLVGPSTLAHLWTRHFLDSAQMFALRPEGAQSWVDFGSGGGFPGLIVAILAAEKAPKLRVTLIEADARKAAFLATVIREVGVTVDLLVERIEELDPRGADIVSARALAPLPLLLSYMDRHLAPGGVGLFAKGATHQHELDEALATRALDVQKIPSKTDPDAVILKIQTKSE